MSKSLSSLMCALVLAAVPANASYGVQDQPTKMAPIHTTSTDDRLAAWYVCYAENGHGAYGVGESRTSRGACHIAMRECARFAWVGTVCYWTNWNRLSQLVHKKNRENCLTGGFFYIQPDHIYLVLCMSLRIAVAHVVEYIKTQSAKTFKAKYGFIQKAIWSRGYFVSTVGVDKKPY